MNHISLHTHLLVSVLVTCLCSDKSNLRKEGFVLVYHSRVAVHPGEAATHTQSQSGSRVMGAAARLSFSF